MSVIGQIEFGWPAQIQYILQLHAFVANIPRQVFSADCLLMQLFFGNNPEQSLFYLRIATFTLLPFIVALVSIIYWLIHGLIRSMPR
jgi:hypothetical protein